MYPLLETVKVLNRQICQWPYHKKRMLQSSQKLWNGFPAVDEAMIREAIRQLPDDGIYKLRIIYTPNTFDFELLPYSIRKVHNLKMVYDNRIDYSHKYYYRNALTELYQKRQGADNIIIVKNGLVTDSYYANLAFLKDDTWYTPEKPLLKGTKRAYLLDKNELTKTTITDGEVRDYEEVAFINAMIELGELTIPTSRVS